MPGLYSHTTRGTGTILTATIYNGDHQNHIDNQTVQMTDDYSAGAGQMQSVADPGEDGSESLATSLAGELERLRFAVQDIKTSLGLTSARWYSTPTGGAAIITGATMSYIGVAAPSGWVLASGRTIGNGASGGTERANADTVTLFTLLYNNWADAQAPVSGGRGANAAADFAANKTITLPDFRGRAAVGKDDMGGSAANRVTNAISGVAATTIGAVGGSQSMTSHSHGGVTGGQSVDHTHSITDPGHLHSYTRTDAIQTNQASASSEAPPLRLSQVGANTSTNGTGIAGTNGTSGGHTHSVAAEGAGASQNMAPAIVLTYIIKL